MAKSRSMQASSGASLAPWLGISLIVILFDQLTKIAVTKVFAYATPYAVAPFFNFLLIFNRGAAFSFLSSASGWQRWAFTALGIAAACVIVYLLKRHGNQKLFSTALSLIMGGALGNVIDRLVHGRVIDFLDFHVAGWHWPAFNLADSAIVVGAVLLVLDELRRVRGAR
jgi:signal peptidase II